MAPLTHQHIRNKKRNLKVPLLFAASFLCAVGKFCARLLITIPESGKERREPRRLVRGARTFWNADEGDGRAASSERAEASVW